MTRTIQLSDAEGRFRELLELARSGDEIIITEDDASIVRLQCIVHGNGKRIPDLGRGGYWMSDDLDEPLPDEFWIGEQ